MARRAVPTTEAPAEGTIAKSVDKTEHPVFLPGSRVRLDMKAVPAREANDQGTVISTAGGAGHIRVKLDSGPTQWVSDARVLREDAANG